MCNNMFMLLVKKVRYFKMNLFIDKKNFGLVVDLVIVFKFQEYMYEQNKRLDQERNVRMILENKMRLLSKEKNEFIKQVMG